MQSLPRTAFTNRFTRELPPDPEAKNFRRQVAGACYSRVQPTKVSAPSLVAWSSEVASLLDLPSDGPESSELLEAVSGNRVLEGMDPHAMCYGGHQFGNWAGQLGDGRAINLGEIRNARGEHWTLQLKGAGPTPYSRGADGLAVLRSSIREFLCSEAMHHLGVPTTRALSIVRTGEDVARDMFYDGNPRMEPGAVVCRVAPSFTRFGNFEIFASRNDVDTLRALLDHTIRASFPELGEPSSETYVRWFHEVAIRTADLIVNWMRVGFVHGVMNTDNMSVLGLTIDYGPYGWLESYDTRWTPNTTDANGRRYCYGAQPPVALWNLSRLGSAIALVVGTEADAKAGLKAALRAYAERFDAKHTAMMAAKLGLDSLQSDEDVLLTDLLDWMDTVRPDMTLFYRGLADTRCEADLEEHALIESVSGAFYDSLDHNISHRERVGRWLRNYRERVRMEGTSDASRRARMNRVNPKYVLRNYLAHQAIEKSETGDDSLVRELLDVMRSPYDEQPGRARFAEKRPDWATTKAGCSMLSCSS